MTFLYITADSVGIQTGGGIVTHHESEALKSLGPCEVWGRKRLQGGEQNDPWGWDSVAAEGVEYWNVPGVGRGDFPKLAHFYAGTFSKTVERLKTNGCKVTYTAAAHDIQLSKREHEKLSISFNYPHLVEPDLWRQYVGGYLAADKVICPSRHSQQAMLSYGCREEQTVVIPHGVELPDKVAPLPKRFTVGYLGACGAPDKGLMYLLQAWKKLNYSDATLVLGGRDSQSEYVLRLIEQFGGGNIVMLGWVKDVSTFYGNISLYVQPSVTEGFGCEVLEAMAHSRAVLCSIGVGAHDIIPLGPGLSQFKVHQADPNDLANAIDCCKTQKGLWLEEVGVINRQEAGKYTWEKIRQRYTDLWKELLA